MFTQLFSSLIRFCTVGFVLFSFITPFFTPFSVQAQQSGTNAINLNIPYVVKSGQKVDVKSVGTNDYGFDGELTLDDEIRYGWKGVDLNTRYAQNPVVGGGYLKVYLTNDSAESNFILNIGASPLKVSSLASKLKPGQNRILFVYYDNTGKPAVPTTKVAFAFQFKNETTKPQIKIVEPAAGTLFGKGITKNFLVQLDRFQLSNTNLNLPSAGKMNVYYNQIDPARFLATISSSTTQGDKQVVKFTNQNLGEKFAQIPDSQNTQIIFVLTDNDGNAIAETQTSVSVITNFSETLNVGIPKIQITEPSKNRTTFAIDPSQVFVIQVENFEILSQPTDASTLSNQDGKGYMQIFVNKQPVKMYATEKTFTLKDLGVTEFKDKIIVTVQLVNVDNTVLSPEAKDSVEVIVQLADSDTQSASDVEDNNWRLIIVLLTVILVVGGIVILITKG